jgi:hypothetical protein
MNAGVDLTAAQAPHRSFIERSAAGERRDERGSNSGEWRSHLACSTYLSGAAATVAQPVRAASAAVMQA